MVADDTVTFIAPSVGEVEGNTTHSTTRKRLLVANSTVSSALHGELAVQMCTQRIEILAEAGLLTSGLLSFLPLVVFR